MYHIIVNPASRSGQGKRIWKEVIQPELDDRGISYNAYFSEKAGDVVRLAKYISDEYYQNPAEEFCRIITLGGDGTVNETLQGIERFERMVIGYIPTGSSNDLARDLGIPKNPLDALSCILNAESDPSHIRPMDIGMVKTAEAERMFAVSCGIGFDAAVCEEAMNSRFKDTLNRMKLGKLTYLGIAVKQIFTAKSVSCDIFLDDEKPIHIKKILFIATMNHRYEGGGFKFCPDADYTDGIFDLCVAGNLPKPVILLGLPTAFFGKHFMIPGINHHRAKRVRITTSAPLWLHTDGEVHQKTDSMEIQCLHNRIRFII